MVKWVVYSVCILLFCFIKILPNTFISKILFNEPKRNSCLNYLCNLPSSYTVLPVRKLSGNAFYFTCIVMYFIWCIAMNKTGFYKSHHYIARTDKMAAFRPYLRLCSVEIYLYPQGSSTFSSKQVGLDTVGIGKWSLAIYQWTSYKT